MTITIYGIKNCDTMKKARAWLDSHSVKYDFHDYKSAGIARDKLKAWSDKLGWETLLNRAGTTFRKLDDADKEKLGETMAIALMLARLVANQMYGISERDPFSFAIVSLLLVMISLLACWIASRRVLNVDPVVALRCE